MKDVLVKEEESLDLRRFQDSIFIKNVYMTGYNWKNLTLRAICELAVFFGINYIDFRFYFIYFYFFFLGFLKVFGKNFFFLFFGNAVSL
jgi:hypothetical protein